MGWLFSSKEQQQQNFSQDVAIVACVLLVIVLVILLFKGRRNRGWANAWGSRYSNINGGRGLEPRDWVEVGRRPRDRTRNRCAEDIEYLPRDQTREELLLQMNTDLADALNELSVAYARSSFLKETITLWLALIVDIGMAAWLGILIAINYGLNEPNAWIENVLVGIVFVAAQLQEVFSLERAAFQENNISVDLERIFNDMQIELAAHNPTVESLEFLYRTSLERRNLTLSDNSPL